MSKFESQEEHEKEFDLAQFHRPLSGEELALLEKFEKLSEGDRIAIISFMDRLWQRANRH